MTGAVAIAEGKRMREPCRISIQTDRRHAEMLRNVAGDLGWTRRQALETAIENLAEGNDPPTIDTTPFDPSRMRRYIAGEKGLTRGDLVVQDKDDPIKVVRAR